MINSIILITLFFDERITMKKLLLVAAAFGLLTATEARSRKIEVHGHRGARSIYPENTLPSIRYAIETGVDAFEFDILSTKDNRLVLHHDSHINHELCLDPNGNRIDPNNEPLIYNLTLAEVQKYDCGTLVNPKHPRQQAIPGTRMPSLEELFEMVRDMDHPNAKKVHFDVEIKSYTDRPNDTTDPTTYAKLTLDVINRYGMQDRCTIFCFNHRVLMNVKHLAPSMPILALTEDERPNMKVIARAVKPDRIGIDHKLLKKEYVDYVHTLGVKVTPWTVNEQEDWDRVIDLGVDGIITDDPARLIRYLKKIGLR
jgi:glycerophosphoryl diester phosphodiesterase